MSLLTIIMTIGIQSASGTFWATVGKLKGFKITRFEKIKEGDKKG